MLQLNFQKLDYATKEPVKKLSDVYKRNPALKIGQQKTFIKSLDSEVNFTLMDYRAQNSLHTFCAHPLIILLLMSFSSELVSQTDETTGTSSLTTFRISPPDVFNVVLLLLLLLLLLPPAFFRLPLLVPWCTVFSDSEEAALDAETVTVVMVGV